MSLSGAVSSFPGAQGPQCPSASAWETLQLMHRAFLAAGHEAQRGHRPGLWDMRTLASSWMVEAVT